MKEQEKCPVLSLYKSCADLKRGRICLVNMRNLKGSWVTKGDHFRLESEVQMEGEITDVWLGS